MSFSALTAFWVISMLFVLTPGADWAYAISAGLRRTSAIPAVAGMLMGHLLVATVVVAGLGVLLSEHPTVLGVITVMGALYVAWVGVGLIRAPGDCSDSEVSSETGPRGQFFRGVGVSVLNPKVFLLLGALMPPFADPTAAWPVPAQLAMLGLVHVVSCALVYSGVATCAACLLTSRPRAARLVSRISGVALILVAASLLFRQLVQA